MKHRLVGGLVALNLLFSVGCEAYGDEKLRVLIPLYIYPSHYDIAKYVWPEVAAAQEQISVTAIINPNNGPDGGPPNSDYVQGIEELRAAGVELMGYVSTRYGTRPFEEVKADIDIYAAFYPVRGIFLDEAASNIDQVEYYQQLYTYIQNHSTLHQTILNHGTTPDPAYLSQGTGDTFVVFENNASSWKTHHFPAYITDFDSSRFAAMVHTTPNTGVMQEILAQSYQNNIGYIFVTDDKIDGNNQNPWDQLPSFWVEEVAAIRALNQEFNW